MTTRNLVSLTIPDDEYDSIVEDFCIQNGYRAQIIDPKWKAPAIKQGDPFPTPDTIANPESPEKFFIRKCSELVLSSFDSATKGRVARDLASAQKVAIEQRRSKIEIAE